MSAAAAVTVVGLLVREGWLRYLWNNHLSAPVMIYWHKILVFSAHHALLIARDSSSGSATKVAFMRVFTNS